MGELERLQASFPDRFKTRVVFFEPEDADESWRQTDLWVRARRLVDAGTTADPGGVLLGRAGATISGTVGLYGPDGEVMFWGGITPSRGHEGASLGGAMIADVLGTMSGVSAASGPSGPMTAPVYGCGLQSTGDVCTDVGCGDGARG